MGCHCLLHGDPYVDFIARLHQNLNKTVSQPGLRDMLIQVLAYDNANSECKKAIQPLKGHGAPLEEYLKSLLVYLWQIHFDIWQN